MPIISSIGRKDPRVRALHGAIYLALVLGAATMVYPFLLMLSGSTRSAVDLSDLDVLPRFLRDDRVLYRKHMEGLFNEAVDNLNVAYGTDFRSFEAVEPPPQPNWALAAAWERFLSETDMPAYTHACGYLQASVSKTLPKSLRDLKAYLVARFGPSIEEVNQAIGSDFVGWNAFYIIPENYLLRRNIPQDTPFMRAFWDFKAQRERANLYYFSAEGFYKKLYLKAQYSRDIAEYNRTHGTAYASYDDVHLSRNAPQGTPKEKEDWEGFVRQTLNLLWIRADESARPIYQSFLRAKYGTIEALNRHYGTAYASFRDVPLIGEPPAEGLALSDWSALISGWKDPDTGTLHIIPAEALRIHSLDFMFRDWLAARYGSLDAINAAFGTSFRDLLEIIPPQRDAHYLAFLEKRRELRWEFATRNYRTVVDYMVFHGRGILNTAIYCTLAVLAALIVNPLAAYAMSRYRMPTTYKILLFLMLTMAFPPMVTQIPVFLMLRQFRLLNTFAALVLPGLANGYAIFLLKGFFDSLPRDLYECAALDGAGEWTLFWQITMSLSKPILSVIALNAFTHAYANFMFALLICQDEKMWTLMVWLYQLQQRSGQPVIYASLVIAAIPTFMVFVFCQKVILRGIVVPAEK